MPNAKPPTKNKHQLRWFKVGMTITKNSNSDLFNPPITIKSENQAIAIWITQAQGHTYTENK